MIFIHSLGQPLIVRSHSKVHHSRGNLKEIPTWASHVSNYSHFPWFNSQQTWRPVKSYRFSNTWCPLKYYMHLITWYLSQNCMYSIPWESVTKLHVFNFNHLASVAKSQVFYYLVSDAKIVDIIYQLSPLLECNPTVCLPSKS